MSEKIELIPATELPVAESDEVDVLCVENGELKRKEGASFGGTGYDAVIDLGVYSDFSNLSDLGGGVVPVGTVKMIERKIASGEMPKVMGKIAYAYYDYYYPCVFEFTSFGDYSTNQVRCFGVAQTYSGTYALDVYLRDDFGDGDIIYQVNRV